MQSSWNQPAWGVQASTAYTVPGYPQPIAGTAVAPTATTMSTIPYQVPGYQWPGYAANPTVPAAAVAAAVPGWSQTTAQAPQNPQQQWEQWQQWQQQYAQWQQQYGKDYVAAMQAAGQLPTATTASGVGPIPGAAPLPGAVPGIPAPNVVPTGINSPANIPSVIAHPPPSSAPPPLPTSAPPIDNQSSKRPPDPKENSSDGKKTKAEIEEALQGIQNSLSDMAEAEKQFDEQFNNWERQFNSWREENANHPDTDQYQAYEAKWTSWRNQLLQRREQMKKKKDAKLAELAKLQTEKTALEAASAIPAPSVTPTSYAQTNPSMPYGNFSVQGYNQQMGMYGVGQSAPMFPPVPPPVGPPISLLGDIPSGGPPTAATPMSAPNFMSVPTATSIASSNPSLPQMPVPQTTGFPVNTNTTQANGSIPSVLPSDMTGNSHPTNMSGGIPGLDLIDANNKQSGAPYAGLQSLTQPPETLKTPADSKPFDFPQMNKNPRMWPPVGMPPPVGMGGLPPGSMGGPPPMGMAGHSDFNSAPKHFNPPSNLNQPPPGMMAPNEFDFNQLPPKHGPLMGPERPDFSNPPPSFNSVNPPHSNSPFNQSIGEMNDSQRWGSQNEDELSRKPPGGFPNSHDRHSGPPFNSRNANNFGPRPTWQPTGSGSKQALLPTPGLPPPTFDDVRQNNEGMKDGPDSNYVDEPWASREEEPWNNNSAQGHPDSKSGPHRPVQGPPGGPRPLLMPPGSPMTGQRGPPGGPMQSHQGPPKGLSNLPTHGTPNGRFGGPPPNDDFMMGPSDKMPPDTLINMDRPPHGMPGFPSGPGDQLRPDVLGVRNNEVKGPPEYFPEVVIDYRHRPADLGIPDMYEPESMIDYAHGANDMDELMKVGALDPPLQKPVSRQPLLPDNRHDHRIHGPWGPPSEWMPPDDPVRPRDRDRRDWDGPRDRDRDRDDRREDRHRDDKRDDRRGRDTDRNRERDRDRSRDRDRRSPGGRWRNDDRKSRDRDRDQRQESRSFDRSRDAKPSPAKDSAPPNRHPDMKSTESHSMPSKLFQINDLLLPPGRNVRPSKIIIILRGPPGSGKSYVAKLLKHKEIEMGGSAPRILSIDDYFMTETDKEETDPETGRKVTKKVMEFEYEAGMESTYQDSLIKAFRKTVADGYFPFIIIDSINSKVSDFEDISGFGRQKGFQVYICDMEMDVNECFKKNVHNRSLKDIAAIIKNWERPPKDEVVLDIRSLLQEASITDVDMEDTVEQTKPEDVTSAENANSSGKDAPSGSEPNEDKTATEASGAKDDSVNTKDGDEETEVAADSDFFSAAIRSKWDDLDSGTNKLDRLDGLSKARTSTTIKDWLQLPEDHFESRQLSTESGGKKRVRWADLEERYEQEKMREIGFVVGQTDWGRMMDPTGGQSKLAQTKYI